MTNGVMLQGFEWDLPADGGHWRLLKREAFRLHRMGVTALWMPPAFKGCGGKQDVGYGVYDLYDLGEFFQKGSVGTKYGVREEYLAAIRALKAAGIQPLADLVLSHRLGADEQENVPAHLTDWNDRLKIQPNCTTVSLYTRLTFPGRKGQYSDFLWDASCFTGCSAENSRGQHDLYLLEGKHWAEDVDEELGNYDYLMGADVDFHEPKVLDELRRWGHWYVDVTGVEGFRLDAVKHISAAFYRDWLAEIRHYTGRELFAVGEYWHCDVHRLHRYLDQTEGCMSLFDVPLHSRFRNISISGGAFNMRGLFDQTLVGTRPHQAVTFVDNHDTQPGQSLESWVEAWFKPAAYGLILLRSFGYPCVFWGDLFGIPDREIPAVSSLPLLLQLRRLCALGMERDYFDHAQILGFTREGDMDHPGSGLVFLCSCGPGGEKRMAVGKRLSGRWFRCALGNQDDVLIDREGFGVFRVADGGCSVYVPRMTVREAAALYRRELRRLAESLLRQGLLFFDHAKTNQQSKKPAP